MAEYIEREAFRAYWNKEFRHRHPDEVYLVALASFPAADVVEVVRCKDCLNYYRVVGRDDKEIWGCKVMGRAIKPNAFCSYGAKMDGKGEG